jgi:ATP/maltotriose-dependent transcriptional regulator MalT
MLSEPVLDVEVIAELLGWRPEQVSAALDELAELSLVRQDTPENGGLRLANPEIGLLSLQGRREAELLEQQQRIAASRAEVTQLIARYVHRGRLRSELSVEELVGVGAVRTRIEDLVKETKIGMLAFIPEGGQLRENLAASRPLNRLVLERGVAMRTIYLDSVRNDAHTMDHIAHLTGLGAQVRTVAALPLRMIVYDGTSALIPVDPEDSSRGALLLRGEALVAPLLALFGQFWDNAVPLGTVRTSDGVGLSEQHRVVLALLAAGNTDESIARKLGVSVRTGRRVIAELMKRLDARARFQAGARAAELGWLSKPGTRPASGPRSAADHDAFDLDQEIGTTDVDM